MNALLFISMEKCIQRDASQKLSNVHSVTRESCGTWMLLRKNAVISGGRGQHKHPYWKHVCCMLRTKILKPVYRRLMSRLTVWMSRLTVWNVLPDEALHSFHLQEFDYCIRMITYDVLRLQSSFLIKVRPTHNFPFISVLLRSVMKQTFYVKMYSVFPTRIFLP